MVIITVLFYLKKNSVLHFILLVSHLYLGRYIMCIRTVVNPALGSTGQQLV